MSMKHVSRVMMFAMAVAPTAPALAQAGDATKGKAVFARCAVCHSVDPGVKKLGPSLSGVFGRTSGTVPGFTYSPAMQKAKIRWDAKSLDGFLAKPSAAVPGSRMVFAGLPNPADRANLLAYLAGATKK
ncbi:cytochrome c family protein [Sphingobium sp. BHU LFT2]|uniref:c-type cytochrome n=1 Tax=Sphingobium sp. BHU LFT2 TaxID=2807634 RepID=UPI001BE654E7|nr:cytochrome c family protein [Sphingobium sp. BHU LFT2]MBT2243156.1 cytochrome c family protein [Sphingobium sp. BHU LFT2]